MGCLSLKLTIGALTAFTVALVAAVCLGITLTVSLDAIRDMGKGNAAALAKGAHAGLKEHFSNPAKSALFIRQRAIAEQWVWPTHHSPNASAFNRIAATAAKDAALLHRETTSRVQLFWLDGSRSSALIDKPSGTLEMEQSVGGPGLFLNGTREYYNVTDLTALPHHPQDNHSPYINAAAVGIVDAMISEFHGDNNTGAWVPPILVKVDAATLEVNYAGVVPIRGGLPNANDLVGVLYFAVTTKTLTALLLEVKATPNTQSMLYDRTKLVVATTVDFGGDNGTIFGAAMPRGTVPPAGCLMPGTNDAILCLPYIANLSVPAFDAVSGDEAFLFNEGRESVRLVKADGKHSYVAHIHVQKPLAGEQVYVLLAVPEEDVIGDVVAGRNLAIGLSCAILVVAVALAVALIVVLLAPLSTVAERMAYAATLEDDEPSEGRSAMAEIAQLEAAYDAMNHELQRLKAFVPQSLLRHDVGDADLDLEASVTGYASNGDTGSVIGSPRSFDDNRSSRSHLSHRSQSQSGTPRTGRSHHSSGNAAMAAGAGLKTDTSLKRQRVTVLCLNTLGFNQACADHHHRDGVAAIAGMVEAVSTAVQDHRGVIDSFHGDRFTATFNAVHACPGHQRKAVHCALRLARELASSGFKLTPTMGVASGDALVGNVGSATLKHFCVLGQALPQAAMLERLAKVYPDAAPHVLLSGRVAADVASNVVVRPVDIVLLPGRTRPSVVSVALGEVEESGAGGEWLYVLQQQGTGIAGALAAAFEQVAAAADREAARATVAAVSTQMDAAAEEDPKTNRGATSPVAASLRRLVRLVERAPAGGPLASTIPHFYAAVCTPGFSPAAGDTDPEQHNSPHDDTTPTATGATGPLPNAVPQ